MRKIIAISFLLVFSFLQYGKTISWLYCELRVEISDSGNIACDCEKILQEKKDNPTNYPFSHSHSIKEKLNEPFLSVPENFLLSNSSFRPGYFSSYTKLLQTGYPFSAFHPPAL